MKPPFSFPKIFITSALLALPCLANAATITVTTLSDNVTGSLRWAVAQAYTGDSIVFASTLSGTMTLSGGAITSQSPKDLGIYGPGPDRLIISAASSGRILSVPGRHYISGITFAKSNGFAVILGVGIDGATFAGGTISNCRFTQNTGSPAVSLAGGKWQFYDCQFRDNTSSGFDFLMVPGGDTSDILHVGACALLISPSASVEAYRCVFANNVATASYGGAIVNRGSFYGWACAFSGNGAFSGGAIFAYGGGVYLSSCTLNANTATEMGGAIAQFNSNVTANTCTLAENSARYGGAFYGGPINAPSHFDSLTLLSSTVAKNKASVISNRGGYGGGLYSAGPAFFGVYLKNTVMAANTASFGGRDIYGYALSQDGNLVGTATGIISPSWKYADIVGTDSAPVDPKLGALANYGGITSTLPLLAGSPAIDKGISDSSVTLDQRGKPRAFDFGSVGNAPGGDGRDIGAFEVQASDSTPLPKILLGGSLDFGSVAVGSSKQLVMTIGNTGDSALSVSGISHSMGAFSGSFAGSVAPGESKSVTVTFAPTAAQSYAGQLTVVSNAASGTATRAETGTGANAGTYTLTANATTGGTVAKSPDSASYSPGAVVSVTATAMSGYQFSGWSGDASGTANPLQVTMSGNKAITANFTAGTGAVATPTISPNGGTFSRRIKVSLSCGTPGAVIRYTTNGAEPTPSSPKYGRPFALKKSATVKAKAFKTGMSASGTAAATFTKAR